MIDPRPYTYEFRKPRLNNPTFQSSNLYESLYHLRLPQKSDYFIRQEQPKQQPQQSFKLPSKEILKQDSYNNPQRYSQVQPKHLNNGYSSFQRRSVDNKQRQHLNKNTEMRNMSSEKISHPKQDTRYQRANSPAVHSHLQNYGENLMKSSNLDRFSIFEKQQKGYNIINCYPNQMSNSLRSFPKLTLQNKLIEKGKYPH